MGDFGIILKRLSFLNHKRSREVTDGHLRSLHFKNKRFKILESSQLIYFHKFSGYTLKNAIFDEYK